MKNLQEVIGLLDNILFEGGNKKQVTLSTDRLIEVRDLLGEFKMKTESTTYVWKQDRNVKITVKGNPEYAEAHVADLVDISDWETI